MKKAIKALAVVGTVLCARLLPLSPIIGSSHLFFSWSTICAPVVAFQCGLSWVASFVLCKKLFLAPSMMVLIHKMPLLCAARAFQKREMWLSVFLPVICMIAFMIHPVGAQAWPYALYWVLPIFFLWLQDTPWTRALQASFIAHAVGSIIWLYFGAISAQVWLSLIAIVWIERLIIAMGIVVCNEICTSIIVWVSSRKDLLFKHKVIT